MTMDKDFGQLIFIEKAPHCGLVRLPDVPAARRIELMERLLSDETLAELVPPAHFVVEGN